MKDSIRWLVFVGALLFSLTGFAAAVIETATGQVRAGPNAKAATAASAGQRIQTGSVIVTGAKSLATLKFDDGQVAVVHENSEFRVAEYVFVKDQPAKDRFSFELLRGALRLVTAAVAPRNPQAYSVRTPMATIGIRGTDFMLAIVNPLYMSVLSGSIAATNVAGTVAFAAGTTGLVSTAATLAVSISAAALPASVAATFSQLGAVTVGAAGAAAATGVAAGGITPAVAAGIAAAAAAAAVAAAADEETPISGTATGTR
jgi:hypothetical protein